jgi:uncharacterized protein (TIGR02246 family)
VIAAWSSSAFAQTSADESRIRMLPKAFEQAWNKHDMKALASLATEDADFVNVGAKHWKGRKEIEQQHAARLSQFMESTLTFKAVTVQFLKPDIALVHIDWAISGDKDPDGSPRKPREGVFSWVVMKQAEAWKIRAAHNTNLSNLQPPVAVTPK